MDQIDYSILNILKHNARETASNISKEVHLSVSSVMNRIRQMEDSGIIKGYEVKVDSKKLGFDVTAFMEVSLEHPKYIDRFHSFFMICPERIACSATVPQPWLNASNVTESRVLCHAFEAMSLPLR